MKTTHIFWRTLGLINFGLDSLILFFLFTEQWIRIPAYLQVLGRSHPLILHFPIVLIVLLPFVPRLLLSLSLDRNNLQRHMGQYITLAHFLCALTVLFGLILSAESGYTGVEVFYHKWGGIILLISLILLDNFWEYPVLSKKSGQFFLFFPMIALLITSHIGAGITHGRDFLTQPIMPKKEKQVSLAEAVVYPHVIQPIIQQKCMNCHNSTKAKGELILEDSTSLLRGGEDGLVLIKGKAKESPLVQRLLLDIDHEDHMPPKGKPQLSVAEIELIREWADRKDLFHVRFRDLPPEDMLVTMIRQQYESKAAPMYDMNPASDKIIQSLNDDYQMVEPIARKSPALYARFLSASHFKSEQLEALGQVNEQVVDLHLGGMPVNDEDLTLLEKFRNLQVLNLNETAISDRSLTFLIPIQDLQKLSLAGTAVSASGIRNLLKKNSIKSLYLWNTTIDSVEISSLKQDFPNSNFTGRSNPFGDQIVALNAPKIKPKEAIFEKAVKITAEHPVPNVILRYTLDGSEPDSISSSQYEGPVEITTNTDFRIKAFKSGWESSPVIHQFYLRSKFRPDSAWLVKPPHEKHAGEGAVTLVDLKSGGMEFNEKSYLGYREEDALMVFEFNQPVNLEEIIVSGLTKTDAYIFPPARIELEVADEIGVWIKAGVAVPEQPEYQIGSEKHYNSFPLNKEMEISGVKIVIKPLSKLPAWHPGKGEKAWIFVDEVLFQ